MVDEAAIRQRAYEIWEKENRPHGRDHAHWLEAIRQLTAEAAAEVTAVAKPAVKRATKKLADAGGAAKAAVAKAARAAKPAAMAKPAPAAMPAAAAKKPVITAPPPEKTPAGRGRPAKLN